MPASKKTGLSLLAAALFIFGAVPFSGAVYMKGKAMLGDVLLAVAWHRTTITGQPAKPWPGADIGLAAKLDFPRLGKSVVALNSAMSEAMAWGVGHVEGTASPGSPGLAAFGGHNDSHFAFLEHIQPGDEIFLETRDGIQQPYRVTDGYVVDSRHWRFPLVHGGPSRLALSTCWPFGSQAEHLRFIVFAERISENSPKGEGAPISSTQPQPGGRAGGSGAQPDPPAYYLTGSLKTQR